MDSYKVLIVEDDPNQARLMSLMLTPLGLACDTVGTLGLALERLGVAAAGGAQSAPPVSCVVLDLTLPDAQGITGVSALQSAHPEIPVVVLTGYPDFGPEALRAGAQDVLTKPTGSEQLARAIRFAVERHRFNRTYRPYTDALADARQIVQQMTEQMAAEPSRSKKDDP